jgi:hypothetical protein
VIQSRVIVATHLNLVGISWNEMGEVGFSMALE